MKSAIMSFLISLSVLVFTSGCSTKTVSPVSSEYKIDHVCIEENPKVIVADFLSAVEKGFERHGITTEVYNGELPANCKYKLTYVAFKTWDIATYLHHAELRLYKDNERIGYAEYHLTGKGGFDLSKWASCESKMNPVIDELLAQQ